MRVRDSFRFWAQRAAFVQCTRSAVTSALPPSLLLPCGRFGLQAAVQRSCRPAVRSPGPIRAAACRGSVHTSTRRARVWLSGRGRLSAGCVPVCPLLALHVCRTGMPALMPATCRSLKGITKRSFWQSSGTGREFRTKWRKSAERPAEAGCRGNGIQAARGTGDQASRFTRSALRAT